jgi:hypothetical protein
MIRGNCGRSMEVATRDGWKVNKEEFVFILNQVLFRDLCTRNRVCSRPHATKIPKQGRRQDKNKHVRGSEKNGRMDETTLVTLQLSSEYHIPVCESL